MGGFADNVHHVSQLKFTPVVQTFENVKYAIIHQLCFSNGV